MRKILIVDDEESLLRTYQTKFEEHGFEVGTAYNGEVGLATAFSTHPDLILLDLRMPIMDGMTMLKKLREDPWGKNVKVVILTNLDASDKILQGIVENHPAYYLVKAHTRPEEVIAKVDEVLQGQVNA